MSDFIIDQFELVVGEFPNHEWDNLMETVIDLINNEPEYMYMNTVDRFDYLVDGIIENEKKYA